MGWVVAGIVLFAVYSVFLLQLAAMSVAMNGARKKPPTRWSVPGMWLLLLCAPLWGPVAWLINRLGYRIPLLGTPFPLGRRVRARVFQARTRTRRH
ncbi:hypothetical protein ACGFMK_42445 [Amycolatopsis sp. NPDC049252]|uniref:hypothetical protein n=1 Tax=Amycolatopsis sp. NPDC049252 TaxID=3363933 RepID=UPI00371F3CC3